MVGGGGRRVQKIQAQRYLQITKDFIALVDVVEKDCRDDFNLAGLENWKREVKRLHMACRACTERVQPPEVCPSPPPMRGRGSRRRRRSVKRVVNLEESEEEEEIGRAHV